MHSYSASPNWKAVKEDSAEGFFNRRHLSDVISEVFALMIICRLNEK